MDPNISSHNSFNIDRNKAIESSKEGLLAKAEKEGLVSSLLRQATAIQPSKSQKSSSIIPKSIQLAYAKAMHSLLNSKVDIKKHSNSIQMANQQGKNSTSKYHDAAQANIMQATKNIFYNENEKFLNEKGVKEFDKLVSISMNELQGDDMKTMRLRAHVDSSIREAATHIANADRKKILLNPDDADKYNGMVLKLKERMSNLENRNLKLLYLNDFSRDLKLLEQKPEFYGPSINASGLGTLISKYQNEIIKSTAENLMKEYKGEFDGKFFTAENGPFKMEIKNLNLLGMGHLVSSLMKELSNKIMAHEGINSDKKGELLSILCTHSEKPEELRNLPLYKTYVETKELVNEAKNTGNWMGNLSDSHLNEMNDSLKKYTNRLSEQGFNDLIPNYIILCKNEILSIDKPVQDKLKALDLISKFNDKIEETSISKEDKEKIATSLEEARQELNNASFG